MKLCLSDRASYRAQQCVICRGGRTGRIPSLPLTIPPVFFWPSISTRQHPPSIRKYNCSYCQQSALQKIFKISGPLHLFLRNHTVPLPTAKIQPSTSNITTPTLSGAPIKNFYPPRKQTS